MKLVQFLKLFFFFSCRTRRGKYGVNSPWQCCICGAHFRPFGGGDRRSAVTVREVRRYTVCSRCHGHVCKSTCGQWVRGDWFCKHCIQTNDAEHSWFKGILTALQPNAVTGKISVKAKLHTITTYVSKTYLACKSSLFKNIISVRCP